MKILSYRDAGYDAFVRRLHRRAVPDAAVRELVAEIIGEVARRGDRALVAYAQRFDGVKLGPGRLLVGDEEIERAAAAVSGATRRAVDPEKVKQMIASAAIVWMIFPAASASASAVVASGAVSVK